MDRKKEFQFIVGHYLIEIDMKLEQKDNKKVFSVCWHVYYNEHWHTFCNGKYYWKWWQCAGQCYKTIDKIMENCDDGKILQRWETILNLRKKYHLNDLHAWTVKQEKFLREHESEHNWDYTKCCEMLDNEWLLYDGKYKYWSGWLYRPIPLTAMKKIEYLLSL